MNELTEKRTPEKIGAEIRMYVDAGRRISLLCGIEIGKRLVEAKGLLDHGEWLPWLERETEFSDRSAARYMKLFEEYGAAQQGLFGPETNSPTLSNLPISKALALLSVPESDRIEFAENVDAEHISVRELEEKIRERDEKLAAMRKDIESERSRGDEAVREKLQTEDLLKTQDGMLAEAREKVAALAKQVRELETRPVEVAVERDEEAIAAAAKEAREKAEREAEAQATKAEKEHDKALKEMHARLEEAKKELEQEKHKTAAVGKDTERIRAELEETRKQLKTSAADVTAFGIRFNSLQTEFGYLVAEMEKVRARDEETGEKLTGAVRELLNAFRKQAGLEEKVQP